MQRYRHVLARLDHGRYLDAVKIDLSDLKPVELGTSTGVQEGHEEDVVFPASPLGGPENLVQRVQLEGLASFGPRPPGKADSANSVAEATQALNLGRLGQEPVVGGNVTQVTADCRPG